MRVGHIYRLLISFALGSMIGQAILRSEPMLYVGAGFLALVWLVSYWEAGRADRVFWNSVRDHMWEERERKYTDESEATR